jgi:hypothetical protein
MRDTWVRTCRVLQFVALLMTAGVVGTGWAEAKKKSSPEPPAPLLAVKINDLAEQLPGVLLEDAGPITSQIQKLVIDHMTEWMESRTPSDVEVRRELESAFSLLRYPISGDPAVFVEPWKGGLVIGAGYSLGWNNFNKQNVVAIFECRDRKARLATVTNFVPYTDLHYEMTPAQDQNDFRFFIYGFRPGKSDLRLSAVYYSFDGQGLKSLWEIHDLYDGKMDVRKDTVVFRYLKEDEYVHAVLSKRKPPRHEAAYQFTPIGMRLLDEHEIPF